MKILFAWLLFNPLFVTAQVKIKKVLVEGQGPPVVMLAGGTGDMSVYIIPSKELSGSYKVIRMENFNVQYANEGLVLPKNYSVPMESEAIKLTLDSLKIKEPIVIVGHSYGGVIAFDFALNYPNRVKSLILLEPPLFGIAEAKKESPEGMKKIKELIKGFTPQSEITEDDVERFRCAMLGSCDTFSIREYPQWKTWVQQKNRLRGLYVVGTYKINFKKLHQFKKPVLVITGVQTIPLNKRIDQLLVKEFPLATEQSIQSGHAIPTTAPRELVRYLLEFIK